MIESSTRTSDLTRVAPVGWRTTHAATPTDHTHAAPTGWWTTHAATPTDHTHAAPTGWWTTHAVLTWCSNRHVTVLLTAPSMCVR